MCENTSTRRSDTSVSPQVVSASRLRNREPEPPEKVASIRDWASTQSQDERWKVFCDLRSEASRKGYKPGWAAVQYRLRYRELPPYEWTH